MRDSWETFWGHFSRVCPGDDARLCSDYVGMDEHQEESRSKQRWRPPEREQYVLKHERFIISNVRRCEINHQRSLETLKEKLK